MSSLRSVGFVPGNNALGGSCLDSCFYQWRCLRPGLFVASPRHPNAQPITAAGFPLLSLTRQWLREAKPCKRWPGRKSGAVKWSCAVELFCVLIFWILLDQAKRTSPCGNEQTDDNYCRNFSIASSALINVHSLYSYEVATSLHSSQWHKVKIAFIPMQRKNMLIIHLTILNSTLLNNPLPHKPGFLQYLHWFRVITNSIGNNAYHA